METDELHCMLALTRIAASNPSFALQIYNEWGSALAVYEHRDEIARMLSGSMARRFSDQHEWSEALEKADAEVAFTKKHNIRILQIGQPEYPQRLNECVDAPLVLYYMGSAELNAQHVVSIVGTRHITAYGRDCVRQLITSLNAAGVQPLIISGLAYGVDVCAHRNALENGMETVGVLAHGLDELYPQRHRDTAKEMLHQGGLLTEYMTQSRIEKMNFIRRNRIVAGMADAVVLIESAAHGGGLVTANIANDYNRAVFAFPGAVGAPYSEGCNQLIRRNGAALITSAADLLESMGWQMDTALQKAKENGIERSLFLDLTDEEKLVVDVLGQCGDLQLNQLSVKTNITIGQVTALLFQLEMKGVVRPMAGGNYHLLH